MELKSISLKKDRAKDRAIILLNRTNKMIHDYLQIWCFFNPNHVNSLEVLEYQVNHVIK